MKFHDRARTMRPDASVLVPLVVLFITSLNGPTVREALGSGLALFISPVSGPILWAQIILLNIAVFGYLSPIFHIHRACLGACEPTPLLVELALKRLNKLRSSTIFLSILVFVAGRLALFFAGIGAARADYRGAAGLPLVLCEAAANGYFVGVIFALQFEQRLYAARETLIRVGGWGRINYSSLYSKVTLILVAIVLVLGLQAFAFAGDFYSLAAALSAGQLPTGSAALSGPEFVLHAGRLAGLREALGVFFLKLVLLCALVALMLFQLKLIIARPLATILDRLKSLNSPDPGSGRAIEVVQNDEFSPVFREINELIRKQQGQLELSRLRLEDIVAGAADPIIAIDAGLRLRLFNPAAEEAFGYRREAVIGESIELLLGPVASTFAEAHASGLARLEWKASSGKVTLMESHVSSAGSGEEAWTVAILRDIGRQAEFEENLRRARVEAENASRMKSEFLANMSHELRTPLNAILGFTQLLDDDRNLTGAQRERIRVITRSGEHLLSLINDILDISKIEAGKMELHPSVFDLWDFLDEMRDMFELKCRKKSLTLYFDRGEGLPRYVRGDLGKLRQIMVNLLGNAAKFTDEGGVSVFAASEGDSIRFAVRDTGRGIPKEEQESILRPFVQASTTDHEGGTGLGLAISSRYVALMGGTFSVESAPGEGSVFSFALPLELTDERPRQDEEGELDIALADGSEVTALVVDDQETNRLVLKEMLERVGFSVAQAENGREAVERAIELRPAIVFMDIKMPVMDGYAAVAALKQDERTRELRVFALTASAFINDEERIEAAGFDGFLAKPFRQSSLYRLIRDRGGIELAPSRSIEAAEQPARAADFREALSLDRGLLARIADAALINDFASLAALAGELSGPAPSMAEALAEAASSYDERALASFLEGAWGARGGERDGR